MTQQDTMPDEIVGWLYAGFFNCAKQLPVSDMGDTKWERYVRAKLYWDLLESWADLKVQNGVLSERAQPKYKRVDLDALCKNTCNCEGDGGPCLQCSHDFGWNEALEYIKSKYGGLYVEVKK